MAKIDGLQFYCWVLYKNLRKRPIVWLFHSIKTEQNSCKTISLLKYVRPSDFIRSLQGQTTIVLVTYDIMRSNQCEVGFERTFSRRLILYLNHLTNSQSYRCYYFVVTNILSQPQSTSRSVKETSSGLCQKKINRIDS